MELGKLDTAFYFGNTANNRKQLFEDAIANAKFGKVIYILYEELQELPELSQDLNMVNKHYLKMITFVYVKSLDSLVQSISTFTNWQNLPFTIILDNLNQFCNEDSLQNACGVVAFLIDTVRRCSVISNKMCKLCISIEDSVGEDYCKTIKEFYDVNIL